MCENDKSESLQVKNKKEGTSYYIVGVPDSDGAIKRWRGKARRARAEPHIGN